MDIQTIMKSMDAYGTYVISHPKYLNELEEVEPIPTSLDLNLA